MSHFQNRLVRELLTKVWASSPFYREHWSSHGIREADLPEMRIADLPFVSKRRLMENFDRVVTDPRLNLQALQQWLDIERDPRRLFRDDFIVMHSSGSSGITGIFAYSRTDWQTMNGLMAARLPRPENQAHGRTRVAFFRAVHGHFAGVATAVHLPSAVYDTLIVSLLDPISNVIEQLHEFQPHRLTGYSSSIARLADQAIQGHLRICPQRIFVSGDLLTGEMERKIQSAWNAPITNLYGASESLFLGIQDSLDKEMRVLTDLNALEILDDDNRPVNAGEAGRVVITNLHNHTVPILRYELGDYVVRGTAVETETIGSIRPGKANDILPITLDNGRPDAIDPRALTSFYAYGVERVQFISNGPGALQIHYVANADINDRVRSEFQRLLDLKGASRMAFEVRRVDSILADADAGKIRLVVLPKMGLPYVIRDAGQPKTLAEVPATAYVAFAKAEVEQSIAHRFERQVQKHPQNVALRTARETLSYEELNQRANRIAHAVLRARGAGQEPVGLLLDQPSAIAALLGILKAGKFYLCLDPSYPGDWLDRIVEDAQCSVLVTDGIHLPTALERGRKLETIINIDELDSSLPDQNTGLHISPDAFGYSYYTSGSTGRPKGVRHTHRHALHQIMTYTNALRLRSDDRCTLLHSHAFSASRLDIFGPLLNGAAVLAFPVATEGVARLSSWLRKERLTVFHWTPSAFRHFLGSLSSSERFSSIRSVILGSETLMPSDVELYNKHFSPACILINRFGSTETGNVSVYIMNKETPVRGGVVPAGFAIEDVEVMTLDETGSPVGFGTVGEIAVKSPYLSACCREPEPSRGPVPERSSEAGVYRTGDLGYMLSDGCLVHVGRNDLQTKIRGRRIEPVQIERCLLEHPSVREAAVVVRKDASGEPRLAAYVAVREPGRFSNSILRSFVQGRLPPYMTPDVFVHLDSLPTTPGGKVDRQRLPEPVFLDYADAEYAAPRNAIERKLAEIWSESLAIPRVGRHDQFLNLGGHSLMAGGIIARISAEFGSDIGFREFFERPTIALLAEFIAAKGDAASGIR